MKRTSLTLIFYLSLVFVSGLVVGALGHRLYTTESTAKAEESRGRHLSPSEWRARYTAMMQDRLALTADQMNQLNVILDRSKARHSALSTDRE